MVTAKEGGEAGDAWTTSVSPAVALSNAADVSYVQTESEDWGGGSSKRIHERLVPAHAWARRALKPSADSAPGLGSGELELSSPPAECARSSTHCASLILSSSCAAPRKTGRVGECASECCGLLRAAWSCTISGKKNRGTIWSTSCSRSMPVSFLTRAAGSIACNRSGPCARALVDHRVAGLKEK